MGHVHRAHITCQAPCAPGVVVRSPSAAHHLYVMATKPTSKPLAWHKNFIGHHRKRAGFSQEQVAEILSDLELIDSHASISRIENGKQKPPIDVIEAMARLYGVDIDTMIYRPPSSPSGIPEPPTSGLAPRRPPSGPRRGA